MCEVGPCHSTSIAKITREAGRIAVLKVDRQPPITALCAAVLTTPAHLVAIERSELPVEFATEVVQGN